MVIWKLRCMRRGAEIGCCPLCKEQDTHTAETETDIKTVRKTSEH